MDGIEAIEIEKEFKGSYDVSIGISGVEEMLNQYLKDVLFLDQNIKLNKNLNETVETLFDLYTNSNLMFNTCENQKSILLNQKDLMQNSINNLTEINKSYTKEIKKQRIKSTAFGIGAAGLVTYIIIKSVSNK